MNRSDINSQRFSWLGWTGGTILVCLVGIFFVYHPAILSHFAVVSGSWTDAKIMITTLEHWYNVLQFAEHPTRPLYFFPFQNTIAYNDALLVSGMIYSVFRFFGADPFLAYELNNIVLRVVGCISTIILARALLSLNIFYSLTCGFIILVATNLALRMYHAQLLYAGFLPMGLLLFFAVHDRIVRSLHTPGVDVGTIVAIVSFGAFIALWALTAFYSLYVFCLFLTVYFISLVLLDKQVSQTTLSLFGEKPIYVITAVVSICAAALSVLAIYGSSDVSHPVGAVRAYSGQIYDLLNVGSGNVMWSGLLAPLYQFVSGRTLINSELSTGSTPLLFIAFVLTGIWLVRSYRSRRDPLITRALSLMISSIFIGALALKTGAYSHWEPFFRYVPGASALRVPMRFLLFITPVVIVLSVFGLSRGFSLNTGRRNWIAPIAASCLLLIAAGQYRVDLPFGLVRTNELRTISSIPPIPSSCNSFFVSVPRHGPYGEEVIDKFYVHSVDAMLIAQLIRVPTINGMASFTPVGWDLHSPFASDYIERTRNYAERHKIEGGLCGLDLSSFSWSSANSWL